MPPCARLLPRDAATQKRCDTHHVRRRSSITILIAAGLLAVAVAGCGGSSKPKSNSSGATKAQYAASANGICKSAAAQTGPLIHQIALGAASLVTGGAGAAQQIASLLNRARADAAASLAKLRALAQPAGDHKRIEKFLTPLEGIVAAMGQAVTALRGGQGVAAVPMLQAAQPLVGQVKSAAQAYGLSDCESVISLLG